jgi:hypothetical protein
MKMNLVHELEEVVDTDGTVYSARVLGAPAEDGMWEGLIEFESPRGRVLWTPIETRQSDLASLVYWSTSLTPIYVEGALARADAETAATDLAAADWAVQERAQQRAVAELRRGIRRPSRAARPSRVQRSVARKPRARAGASRRP